MRWLPAVEYALTAGAALVSLARRFRAETAGIPELVLALEARRFVFLR